VTTSTVRRLAWGLFAGTAVLVGVGTVFEVVDPTASSEPTDLIFLLTVLVLSAVGALVASHRPANPIGWIFVGMTVAFVLIGIVGSLTARLTEPSSLGARVDEWIGAWVWVPFIFVPVTYPLLLFPDGHLLSPRWRWLVWATAIGIVVFSFGMAFDPDNFEGGRIPIGIRPPAALVAVSDLASLVLLVGLIGSAAAVVFRFRRSRGDERQQMRWLAYSGLLGATCVIGSFIAGGILTALGVAPSAGNSTADRILNVIILLGVLAIPVGMAFAILKYQLYEIDLVIKKTLVFGILVVLCMAVAAVLAAVGASVVAEPIAEEPALVLAMGLGLGLLVRPLYRLSRRIADRVVYGGRASPYEVLSVFSERVGETFATEDVLARMAQRLGEAAGARAAAVWVRVGRQLHRAAAWPAAMEPAAPVEAVADELPPLAADAVVEVRHQGELLGALTVAMAPNDPMSSSKERIVRDVARQAGLVLRNVRLVEELRASRQRLVSAQDQERRRVERNIHDGVQQQLVALMVRLKLADQLVDREPVRAHDALAALQADTGAALEDLRDLARGIYPPLLADQGLAAALEAHARKAAVPVDLEADGIGRSPPDVEATVYFCCLEALNNVAKYAEATRATVRLFVVDGDLAFEVSDDGRGFDAAVVANGTGLQGMADRLAALGGELTIRSAPGTGTVVAGRLPMQAIGGAHARTHRRD
jgi:signal transduction histidine kinase